MNAISVLIGGLLKILVDIGEIILACILTLELSLRNGLELLGAPPLVQTELLAILLILLIAGSIKMFSGLIRVAIVLGLVLIVMHVIMPVLQG